MTSYANEVYFCGNVAIRSDSGGSVIAFFIELETKKPACFLQLNIKWNCLAHYVQERIGNAIAKNIVTSCKDGSAYKKISIVTS
jgi:hypothetical protein